MYIFLRIILIISVCLIAAAVVELPYNYWQKKHKKENAEYSKDYTKFLLLLLIIGIVGAVISVPFLLFKLY